MDGKTITGIGVGALLLGGAAFVSTRSGGSLGAFFRRDDPDPRLRYGKCRIWVTDVLDEGYDFPLSRVGWKLAAQMAADRGDGTFVTLYCQPDAKWREEDVGRDATRSIPIMQNIKGKLVVEGTGGAGEVDFLYGNDPV